MEKIEFSHEEMQYYAKAKAEGRLLIAPCKIGEYVYCVLEKNYMFENQKQGWFAYVKKSKLTEQNFCRLAREFGKTVFLSEVEANELLKKFQSKHTYTKRTLQNKRSNGSIAYIDMSYDTRHSHGLKVYASDEPREERCCGSCGNRVVVDTCSYKCAIDGHYIGYADCDYCWCRRWKRNRRFDDVGEGRGNQEGADYSRNVL